MLFVKVYEERELHDGARDYNRFTLQSVREMRRQGVEIIQRLWKDTISSARYREVFADDGADQEIALPPEAIDKIVDALEGKSLVLTDMDVKGIAFEEFLSATYRRRGLLCLAGIAGRPAALARCRARGTGGDPRPA